MAKVSAAQAAARKKAGAKMKEAAKAYRAGKHKTMKAALKAVYKK